MTKVSHGRGGKNRKVLTLSVISICWISSETDKNLYLCSVQTNAKPALEDLVSAFGPSPPARFGDPEIKMPSFPSKDIQYSIGTGGLKSGCGTSGRESI